MQVIGTILLMVLPLCASSPPENGTSEKRPPVQAPAEQATESQTVQSATPPASDGEASDTSGRTELNLLGKTDTDSGESRRNENVQFNPIDNNALKELNQRLGATATVVEEFRADQRYFGAEYGNSPGTTMHVAPVGFDRVHGNVFYGHGNSVFSARSFFQAGNVKPAQEHNYGFDLGAPVWRGGYLTVNASQQKIRGSVNGNVLVPKADERTPLTDDPDLNPLVSSWLAAYPAELPNRTDINPRALNTNAKQRIDDNNVGAKVDQHIRDRDHLILQYEFMSQMVDAFQLVAGQNPDTTTRVHRARSTWNRVWSAATLTNFSVGFDRVGSVLVPEENAVGPLVLIGSALQTLGPTSSVPIDRAQNLFRYAGEVRQIRGRHNLYTGFDLTRRQYNGLESSSHRGTLSFTDDFGRSAIENFRLAEATKLSGAIGNIYRGYRRWETGFYAGDDWKATASLTVNIGLRWAPVSRPTEVNNLNDIPYASDWNNLAPLFGFAWKAPGRWGVIRAAYGIHYGEIYPVTFGQTRFNPPLNNKFEINLPDLRIPLDELLETGLGPDAKNVRYLLSDDLSTPYSHQYNFSWQPISSPIWSLELGYVGSRSYKLLSSWSYNRARVVPGIEQITDTIQERRPDPQWGEERRVLNGSSGFFDAARVNLAVRAWEGLSVEGSYWFSKAIDLGTDYTNTASDRDAFEFQGRSQDAFHAEMKGLSNFDQPHSFLLRGTYEIPRVDGAPGWVRSILSGWMVGAVALLKSGTPFSVVAGSDGPGSGNVDGAFGDRPHLLDPSVLGRTIGHPDTSTALLPTEAFAFMEPSELRGSLGRNTFRKGRIFNVNAMLSRTFPISGERQIEFRADSVNLLNTPQFASPGYSLTSDDFGYITNTLNDGRAFRFQLNVRF